jgi:hypothetical protein
MEEIDELLAEARSIVARIARLASLALLADADAAEVMGRVDEAIDHLENIEAYALLADAEAKVAINGEIVRLRELRDSLDTG